MAQLDAFATDAAGTDAAGADASAGTGDLVMITFPTGEIFGYSLVDATLTGPVVSGSTATYRDVLASTDLQIYTTDAVVKETAVLKSPAAPHSWLYALHLQGLTAQLGSDGDVVLVDGSGGVVARIPHGVMEDSKVDPVSGDGAHSEAITYALTTTADGSPALQVTADAGWLADPARVFPVKVDPTTVYANASTFASTAYTSDQSGSTTLRIGHAVDGQNAYSFLKFDAFSSAYYGKHITEAWLNLNVMWTGACPSSRGSTFHIKDVTSAWTPSAVRWTNLPSWDSAASADVAGGTGYPDTTVCGNTSNDPEVGAYWSFSFYGPNALTMLTRWTSGGANNGIALTTSFNTTDDWVKVSSATTTSHKPYLYVTYSDDVSPQIDKQYPPNGFAAGSLTPELIASGSDTDNWPSPLTYKFYVFDSANNPVVDSGSFGSSRSWKVPANKLVWGSSYWWTVQAFDGVAYSSTVWSALSVQPPQPPITSQLSANGGKGFNGVAGNYTTQAMDAQVATVGPPLAITRYYNSRDPRTGNAFGPGWSSILDSKVSGCTNTGSSDTDNVTITYPGGQDVTFGRNFDGVSFSAPSGRYAVLTLLTSPAGCKLVDKDGTVFTFTQVGSGLHPVRLTPEM